jgi:hypothetical protein
VKKAIRMKKKNSIFGKTTILTCALVISILLSFPVNASSSVPEKELLYAHTRLVNPSEVATMIVFNFNDTNGLPINVPSAVFEHLQTAKFYSQRSARKWAVQFWAYYDSISLNLANNYSDTLCEEFLKAFELNLTTVSRDQKQTDPIETHRTLESASYDIPTTSKLLRYKPSEGFGKLIANFLSKYVVPDSPTTGLMSITWEMSKNSDKLSWELTIDAIETTSFDVDKSDIELNLNKLLNNSEPILISESSRINIEVDKEFAGYSLSVVNISPVGYAENDTGGTILITYGTYGSPNSLQNVIVKLRISKGSNNFGWTIAVIIGIVVATLAGIAVRKRRKNQKRVSIRHSSKISRSSRDGRLKTRNGGEKS